MEDIRRRGGSMEEEIKDFAIVGGWLLSDWNSTCPAFSVGRRGCLSKLGQGTNPGASRLAVGGALICSSLTSSFHAVAVISPSSANFFELKCFSGQPA
ncbi:hypothetical protein AVEN_170382-1 [Araneus ventricosus]|uniref:Uncharacterized protein n=1 Tax=Araneus ventricosus TaxID=182803 RepID=A0A4Y2DRZ1_ARAVE|nr:hypothetical protein AVEN_170382-1 [Araneus ventricosus]